MRPSCVTPRLPPSPTTLARSSAPQTRIASLALSPTSALDSDWDLTYVPMPPFQNTSTGALTIARMSSAGLIDSVSPPMPSAVRTCGLSGIDLADRG